MRKPKTQYVANADAGAIIATPGTTPGSSSQFGPGNPFYGARTLPFQAPPFDSIQDSDYQPAIEAGMAQQLAEIRAIADSPDLPDFENTLIALEKRGRLLDRAMSVFHGV